MSTPIPSGKLAQGPNGLEVQFHRALNYSPEQVWAFMTVSAQLEQWIGRWEGDPATGEVTFYMTAEGESVDPEQVIIRECDEPRRVTIETSVGEGAWHLRFTLQPTDAGTALMFAQVVGADALENVGPGLEYYLDRLLAVLDGRDVTAINWDDYYPAMSHYYRSLQDSVQQ